MIMMMTTMVMIMLATFMMMDIQDEAERLTISQWF